MLTSQMNKENVRKWGKQTAVNRTLSVEIQKSDLMLGMRLKDMMLRRVEAGKATVLGATVVVVVRTACCLTG